jgi:hypothetical protein
MRLLLIGMADCEIALGSDYLNCCNSDVLDIYGVYLHNLMSVSKGYWLLRCAFIYFCILNQLFYYHEFIFCKTNFYTLLFHHF